MKRNETEPLPDIEINVDLNADYVDHEKNATFTPRTVSSSSQVVSLIEERRRLPEYPPKIRHLQSSSRFRSLFYDLIFTRLKLVELHAMRFVSKDFNTLVHGFARLRKLKWLWGHTHLLNEAVKMGSLSLLQWMKQHGFYLGYMSVLNTDKPEIVSWAYRNGVAISEIIKSYHH